ncbi:MAG: GerMN domain-containing protein, partial [Propionibacteriaceae bacterium]|nr:GerMN domain-containing protein [Propionibacteriaceae bacterium]
MRKRRAILIWAALVLVLVSGCTRIPTTGPVDPAAGRGRVPEVSVEVAAEPPEPGASPRTVVEGFLQAMANYQQDYAVARLYLASEQRESWRPESGVTVYEDGYGVSSTPESARLEAPLRGRLGADGSYQSSADQLVHDFMVVRDADGEWRIGNPPEGLLVSHYLFEKFYRMVNIYFFDPTWTSVVADPVFLPTGNQTPTALLQALLRGPTDWLTPAVVTAMPAQARLNVQSAFIDEMGVVEVSLNEAVGGLAEEQRSRMAGQVTWTLGQLEGVTGVRFLINGAPYAVPEAEDGVVRIQAFTRLDPSPDQRTVQVFGATSGGLVMITDPALGGQTQAVPGPLGSQGGIEALAVSAGADRLAFVSANGSVLRAGTFG